MKTEDSTDRVLSDGDVNQQSRPLAVTGCTKTYVITLSEYFPSTHSKKGKPTNFFQSFINKFKKHTIRLNYGLWKKRIDEVNAGRAVLSVRAWTGKPYRSPQIEWKQFDKTSGIGIQKLELDRFLGWFIDDIDTYFDSKDFAANDGLLIDDFEEWFKKVKPDEPMAIIHFTSFRYSQ